MVSKTTTTFHSSKDTSIASHSKSKSKLHSSLKTVPQRWQRRLSLRSSLHSWLSSLDNVIEQSHSHAIKDIRYQSLPNQDSATILISRTRKSFKKPRRNAFVIPCLEHVQMLTAELCEQSMSEEAYTGPSHEVDVSPINCAYEFGSELDSSLPSLHEEFSNEERSRRMNSLSSDLPLDLENMTLERE